MAKMRKDPLDWTPIAYSTAGGKHGEAKASIFTITRPHCFAVNGGDYDNFLYHGTDKITSASFDDEKKQMTLNKTTTYKFRYGANYDAIKEKIKSLS